MSKPQNLIFATALLISGGLFTGLAKAAQDPKPNAKWLVAHTPENKRLVEEAQNFVDRVAKRTRGRVRFELVFPADKLRDGNNFSLAAKQIANNDIQASQIGTRALVQFDKKFQLFDLPFLFDDNDHVTRVVDGEVGRSLREHFVAENKKVRSLDFTYSGGFRVFVSNAPLRSLADFKGQRIVFNRNISADYFNPLAGLPKDSLNLEILKAFGLTATLTYKPINSELDLFSTGAMDVSEDHYSHYTRLMTKYGIVPNKMKYVLHSHHTVFLTSIVVNEKFYQSVSRSDQQILQEEAHTLALAEREESISIDRQAKEWMESHRFTISTLSEEERKKMVEAVQPIYERFGETIGHDLIKKTRALSLLQRVASESKNTPSNIE